MSWWHCFSGVFKHAPFWRADRSQAVVCRPQLDCSVLSHSHGTSLLLLLLTKGLEGSSFSCSDVIFEVSGDAEDRTDLDTPQIQRDKKTCAEAHSHWTSQPTPTSRWVLHHDALTQFSHDGIQITHVCKQRTCLNFTRSFSTSSTSVSDCGSSKLEVWIKPKRASTVFKCFLNTRAHRAWVCGWKQRPAAQEKRETLRQIHHFLFYSLLVQHLLEECLL